VLEGVVGQHNAPAVFTPEKESVPVLDEAGWASGPIWTGQKNLAPFTGVRTHKRLTRSESLFPWHRPVPLNILASAFLLFSV
jgi:hypothetical protein